jgi:thiol-disulfide isomerase/thioredoxin
LPILIRSVFWAVAALFLATAPIGAVASGIEKLTWSESPQPATDAPFQNGKGDAVTLADYHGKVVVVNLWATWCAPCIREMPTLDTLQSELGGDDLHVIAMSQDREGEPIARPFMEKNEWSNLDLYVAPNLAFARAAEVKGLPTTLIIDKQGREVARLQGTAEWDSTEVRSVLEKLIDEGESSGALVGSGAGPAQVP